MGTIQDARKLLAATEESLRGLIERALHEQRYGDVADIAGLADGVARLLNGRPDSTSISTTAPPGSSAARTPPKRRGNPKPKPDKLSYPRFERDGDRLVKIGWSKKNRESYEHRAPREAFVAFVRHLCSTIKCDTLFMVEDILPVPDLANSQEVPAYQVYLFIAWLRHLGALEKRGRDGYVLSPSILADGAQDALWSSLPIRKN